MRLNYNTRGGTCNELVKECDSKYSIFIDIAHCLSIMIMPYNIIKSRFYLEGSDAGIDNKKIV